METIIAILITLILGIFAICAFIMANGDKIYEPKRVQKTKSRKSK